MFFSAIFTEKRKRVRQSYPTYEQLHNLYSNIFHLLAFQLNKSYKKLLFLHQFLMFSLIKDPNNANIFNGD